ncbi:hypothetical protein FM104_11195 [Microbacterium esteraromaticum]|uniref:Uncharacterized protein n=1 Tax=Microbacterium esteraromaticum TaxID=57043 RepID=A0A1R4KA07_9MICO|nr:hypothetical protein FM104_11195 [Microbacterium esteraromaticum]
MMTTMRLFMVMRVLARTRRLTSGAMQPLPRTRASAVSNSP